MKMDFKKRGQGLPLTTIIIAILVVVVLVVLVAFFLGGTTSITRGIKSLFFGTTAGTDLTIAVETCRNRCDQAQTLPSDTLKRNSAYCKTPFHMDYDKDGEVDVGDNGEPIEFYCWDDRLMGSTGCADVSCK